MRLIRGYWKSTIIYLGILYISLLRTPKINLPTFIGADKYAHVVMYLVLGIALCWESLSLHYKVWQWWLFTLIIPIFYGGIIELIQEYYFPTRSGEWYDWVADCVGILIGVGIVKLINSLHNKYAK